MAFGSVDAAKADISGLTPCSESKQFAKREKNEIKALTKRLGKVNIDRSSSIACMHACQPYCAQAVATSGPELALKASDAVAMLSVMHSFWCMVNVRLCKGVMLLNLIFDTLQRLIQVCGGLRTNFGHGVHILSPL